MGVRDEEPLAVVVVREVLARFRHPDDYSAGFRDTRVYVKRPETPCLFVAEVPGPGR